MEFKQKNVALQKIDEGGGEGEFGPRGECLGTDLENRD